MELDHPSGVGARPQPHRSGLAWRRTPVEPMTNIMFVLTSVAVLLAVGVLIGSGLHTRSFDRKYRQIAQLTREWNEREEAMARSAYPSAVCEGCPLEFCRLMLPSVNGNGVGRPADLPTCRRAKPPHLRPRNAVVGAGGWRR